ncbi:hypothetical protein Cob_v002914 [Colletotrichum orbiculare MAFF 240422]|uniref:Uncharacterized protein n=1 Tax=Colletotrichum orbiculare (strain 104-T / ATCC 96160 / CBS 514.97 / LARS 414 / MAFF 240422) TaxID=1213857 RepID=A0A484G1L0_COLOR|nr:hypothetical protein Cob_v002914 [Colletotrichum orbiculare MAFF 240422]
MPGRAIAQYPASTHQPEPGQKIPFLLWIASESKSTRPETGGLEPGLGTSSSDPLAHPVPRPAFLPYDPIQATRYMHRQDVSQLHIPASVLHYVVYACSSGPRHWHIGKTMKEKPREGKERSPRADLLGRIACKAHHVEIQGSGTAAPAHIPARTRCQNKSPTSGFSCQTVSCYTDIAREPLLMAPMAPCHYAVYVSVIHTGNRKYRKWHRIILDSSTNAGDGAAGSSSPPRQLLFSAPEALEPCRHMRVFGMRQATSSGAISFGSLGSYVKCGYRRCTRRTNCTAAADSPTDVPNLAVQTYCTYFAAHYSQDPEIIWCASLPRLVTVPQNSSHINSIID